MIKVERDSIEDLFEMDQSLCIATKKQHVDLYDFDFRKYFQVNSIIHETKAKLILRIGAIYDYERLFNYFCDTGQELIHTKNEHELVSLLPNWYEKISELTPKSMVFDTFPTINQIENNFSYPIFLKGERQTNKHNKKLCIAENKIDLQRILNLWKTDPILFWQKIIVRDFVYLQAIEKESDQFIQKSLEIRVFVWYGKIVGMGQYWDSFNKITLSPDDVNNINELTNLIYTKVQVPFFVIDFGKTMSNEWIVIELNDAQESGYAFIPKIQLWNNIKSIGIPD